MSAPVEELKARRERLSGWLDERALPLWLDKGYSEETGFFELVGLDGEPVAVPVRARVNPRQAFVFAEAGRRGFRGDWEAAALGGLLRMDTVYRGEDGLYAHLAAIDGTVLDARFDLYNHAFVLLALSAVAAAIPQKLGPCMDEANALLDRLRARFAHPVAGFEEAEPPRAPLKANPHMHMLEAALALSETGGEKAKRFAALADEIVDLALSRLIDAKSGALPEWFDRDWRPMEGRGAIEPGHQFEWAWLLMRWAGRKGGDERAEAAARRLFDLGEAHGIDPGRGVAVMEMGADLTISDPLARLWSQTEWLKAALILAQASDGEGRQRYLGSALGALDAFERFLDVPVAGLWRDKMEASGEFIDEPAPASTLYHIVIAIHELTDRLAVLQEVSR